LKTLNAFDESVSFLEEKELSPEEITKNIVGAIGDLDAHMLPDAKGFASMLRYLTVDTEEDRQKMRDEILGTGHSAFKEFVQILKHVRDNGIVKVLGSPSAIEKATNKRPGWLDVVKVL
jgi:Zn-dependent M16 (insulinase) family peptidase